MGSDLLLDVARASVAYTGRAASFRLDLPALRLTRGGRLALLGLSGCGKSTLLNLLALALRPDRAACFAFSPAGEAVDVAAAWREAPSQLDALRARHVGYVMQNGGLLGFLNVRQNIELQARIGGCAEPERAQRLAERLGVADQMAKRPAMLSAGQRQRVAIARALMHRPALILADEPTSALDPAMARDVLRLLLDETARAGTALVVASHDHALVGECGLPVMSFAVSPDRQRAIAGQPACA
jgi:putative ABC transport system ATP-binding protein